MNRVLLSEKIPAPFGQVLKPSPSDHKILLERIKYLTQFGSNILQVKINDEYFKNGLIDQLVSALEKAVNVEDLYIQLQLPQSQVDNNNKLLNFCLTNLKQIKTIEISQICLFSVEQINMLKSLDHLKTLDLEFNFEDGSLFDIEYDFKPLCEVLPSLKSLEILRITINNKNFAKLADKFFTLYSPLNELKELHLVFECQKLNERSFKIFQEKILAHKKLESLKISFLNSIIPQNCFSTFFTQIKKANLNLQKFYFVGCGEADQTIFSNIKTFLAAQKNIDTFEISGFLFKEKLLEPFGNILISQKNLKCITIDIFKNSLRNAALSQIGSSLSRLKQLQEVKILFDESNYSGQSVIELGEAFKSLKELKDLRLEFPGKVREDIVLPFAECIAKCAKLNYLYIFFQGTGGVAEFVSQSPTSTIFENKYFKLQKRQGIYGKICAGSFNYILFSLVIANHLIDIKHIELTQIQLYKASAEFQKQTNDQIKNLIQKCTNLESLTYKQQGWGYYSQKEFDTLIENNANTLLSVSYSQQCDESRIKPVLEAKKLLQIEFIPMVNENNLIKYLKQFPRLIHAYIGQHEYYVKSYEELEAIIQSDVIIDNLTQQPLLMNKLQSISFECSNLRKSALHILYVYRLHIQNLLLYQQDLSHLDLWLDLYNDK